ncbi:MAG: glycosyltransferase WbuB [Bacteroidia bacterium]|nr:MAG: glycosyltransferase WbuB [Bacteroidia bacterium]
MWIKVPTYSSAHSVKRVLKWFWYTLSLFFLPVKKIGKPDYIIVSPMQTMPIFPAYRWAKKIDAKLIFEVKDIWPLSIQELGGYSAKHPFIQILKFFERFAITKSDAIVSVLPNYQEYLKDEGFSRKFHYIPNGIDVNEVNNTEPLSEEVERLIPKNKFIVGYAGTIGKANALHYLIETAIILKDNPDIAFVIVGDGNEKEKLKQMVNKSSLNNVHFINSVPKKQIQSLLKKFDVCYIGLEHKQLFRYGVSPNKLFDYLYASRPVIFAIYSPGNVVEQANAGFCVYNSYPDEIANSILKLHKMPKEGRMEMGNKGREFVLKHHSFEILAKNYKKLLENL